jgi:hypothetical protein
MVLPVKPTAEDIKAAVLRPSRFIREPTRQLFDENLLSHFTQDFMNVLFRVTFGDEIDRRIFNHFTQGDIVAGGIGRVQPV